MKIIDTHLHLLDTSRFRYDWRGGFPTLKRNLLFEEYLSESRETGIEKAVFMEVDVAESQMLDEARYVESLAVSHPFLAGIVASGRPELNGFEN